MTFNLRSALLPLGALVLAPTALAQVQGLVPSMSRIEIDTAAALNLDRVDVIDVELQGTPGYATTVTFRMDGQDRLMLLEPHSVRAEGFSVLEDQGNGELVPVVPDVVRTYRGELLEFPGSTVAAGWQDEGLFAQIVMPDGSRRWLEPVRPDIEGANERTYALYSDSDIREIPGACGVDDAFRKEFAAFNDAPSNGDDLPPIAFSSSLLVAELACDADFEYFQDYGSVQAVQNRIETVINAVNQQYEDDLMITHEITTIIVRSNSSDPYTSSSASTLLNQFRNEWNSNQNSIPRDVAHLFTGRNLTGSTIGVAYVGVICSSFNGYGLVESDCCFGFGSTTDLSAHELGHNWSADHCSCGNPSYTMNASLTGANRFSPTQTIPQVTSYAANRPCLDEDTGFDPPPIVTGYSPSFIEAVNPDSPVTVTLNGSGFTGVTEVLVNGQELSLAALQYSIPSDVLLNIQLAAPLAVGNYTIELRQGSSSTTTQVPISFNTEPTIDLVGSQGLLFTALPIELYLGGSPGDLHFLLLSTTLEPSSIPGLLETGIGANLTDLFLLGTYSVSPLIGVASLSLPISGSNLAGTTLYFQSVVLTSSQPLGPLVSSNIEAGTIFF